MSGDIEFNRYLLVHSSLKIHPLWQLSIKASEHREAIYRTMKLKVTIRWLGKYDLRI